MTDISFPPGSGLLFANDSAQVITPDTSGPFAISAPTGAAIARGATDLTFDAGETLRFDQAGTLFESESSFPLGPSSLNRINLQIAVGIFLRSLVVPSRGKAGFPRFNAMDFIRPLDGCLRH